MLPHLCEPRSGVRALLAAVAGALICVAGVAPAAQAAGPQWTVTAVSRPTNFLPGDATGDDAYVVTVTNTGSAASNAGEPIAITDELPAGITLGAAGAAGEDELAASHNGGVGSQLSCVLRTCTYSGVVVPDDTLVMSFPVDVATSPPPSCAVPAGAQSCVTNAVRVSGGGAAGAGIQTPTLISATPAGFGIAPGGASSALSSVQAGAHPDLTTAISFNTVGNGGLAGDPKDTTDDLPPGFAGDLVDTPSCLASRFLASECPIGTQVGVTTVTFVSTGEDTGPQVLPLYNLAPGPGEVAKLGFAFGGQLFFEGDVTVRPGDYGLRTTFHNANEGSIEVEKVSLTIWGVPADSVHDALRWKPNHGLPSSFGVSSDAAPAPFFTSPTGCSAEPLVARFTVNSWEHPEQFVTAPMPFGPLVGCDRLGMEPSLVAEATTSRASAPTGLDVTVKVPQTYDNAGGLASSTLRQAVVTLPEGMTVNPSAGSGLAACTTAEFEAEAVQEAAGGCPNASKLGAVRITTPSLKEEVTGSVFLAQPYQNPFGSLLALYVVARIPDRGVLVKAAGEVSADPLTGRLVSTFDTSDPSAPHAGLPPLPFSTFTLAFRQGETSPLVSPPACGSYAVSGVLTPAAVPTQPLTALAPSFALTSGFDGGACPAGGVPPFAPQVLAGTQSDSAGSYSPFYLRIARGDGEQEITRFSTIFPPGVSGNLTGIPFCPDAAIEAARGESGTQQNEQPSCPAASQIGHTSVGAGVGSVLAQAPGRVYLAGPYHGSALSIVSITSATVGPFDLGTVVVRFALRINPSTAQVEVDGTGSDPIPHIIRGIVVHVRDIRVYIDRGQFIINPTSCAPQSFTAIVTGAGADPSNPAGGVPVSVTNRFQAADCQALAFKPGFKATTSGKTSRAKGASLSVKLSFPKAPLGSEANIRSVKVDLPKQLPARLTTLQKACTAAAFNANPASCPAASVVGHAKAITPILPVPLEGPAYFVSHGGEAFPSLIVVLQGYGVTIDLVGTTFISKTGVTSSTFKTVPDQPVSSFELTLPQGKFSALAANGNLCKSKLTMPTAFVAQNGATLKQSTPISVGGCHKAKKVKKAHGKAKKAQEQAGATGRRRTKR
jgi:hypothetical protein